MPFNSSYDEGDAFPPSYIVMQLSKRIKAETVNWLINKITQDKKDGGCQLLIRAQPFVKGQRLTFHISATNKQLLELAEEIEIRKTDKSGILREFCVKEISEFLVDVDEYNLLTTAEKQVIVKHELDNLRALKTESAVPGYPHISLYEGQSIILALSHYSLVKQIFPPHEEEEIKKLGDSWYLSLWTPQPYESIRAYFGESIALYFQFLGFYTVSLFVPMFLGFFQMFAYAETMIYFCIINIISSVVFLELWRRKCMELSFIWGTIGMTSMDEPRPNYQGDMVVDPVTNKILPYYPRWKTNAKMYLVSFPLVIICLIGGYVMMLISFQAEDYLKVNPDIPSWVIYIPSIIYSGLIYVTNLMYRQFATFLTEWENHRTQSQFDRHRVTKLVLFEFVNNFISMFYIAFIYKDMDMLRTQIAIQMIILQIINNVQESVIPLILQHYSEKVKKFSSDVSEKLKTGKSNQEQITIEDVKGLKCLDPDDSRVQQATAESIRDFYEDPYDDYLELFVQFGYVYLFSAVYPMAGFWAVFNNFLEIRSDAFKLCRVYQRPFARRVKDTGAWQRAFQVLCSLSIMTNCALFSLAPELKALYPEVSDTAWIVQFVILEHILLGLKQVLHFAIPDKPEWVKVALAHTNRQSRLALKTQGIKPRQFSNGSSSDN